MYEFLLLLNADIFYLSKDLLKVANSQLFSFITKLLNIYYCFCPTSFSPHFISIIVILNKNNVL